MDLLKAIEDVLKSAHQPLHVGVIAEKVISGGPKRAQTTNDPIIVRDVKGSNCAIMQRLVRL